MIIDKTVVANKNGKYGYKVPISWMVSDYITVKANSLDEALKYCDDNFDELPLGDNPQYIDASYEVDTESASGYLNERIEY